MQQHEGRIWQWGESNNVHDASSLLSFSFSFSFSFSSPSSLLLLSVPLPHLLTSQPQNNFMDSGSAEAGPGSYNSKPAHGKQIESYRRTMPSVKFAQAPLPNPADNTPSPGPAYTLPVPKGRECTIGKAVRGGFFSAQIDNNAG